MANEITTTVIGNLTADPELRFTPNGNPVANFTIASTSRRFDKVTNQWIDNETCFMRCSLWGDAAENCVETLSRGQRVMAYGIIEQRNWETKEGDKRSAFELRVTELGASLTFATAKITRVTRETAEPDPVTEPAPARATRPARNRSRS